MNSYYKVNTRNFANEYTIYVMPGTGPHPKLLDRFPQAKQITRAEAIEYGIRKPNWAKRNAQQWWGGFATTVNSEYQRDRELRGDSPSDTDLIAYAVIATADIMAGVDA